MGRALQLQAVLDHALPLDQNRGAGSSTRTATAIRWFGKGIGFDGFAAQLGPAADLRSAGSGSLGCLQDSADVPHVMNGVRGVVPGDMLGALLTAAGVPKNHTLAHGPGNDVRPGRRRTCQGAALRVGTTKLYPLGQLFRLSLGVVGCRRVCRVWPRRIRPEVAAASGL